MTITEFLLARIDEDEADASIRLSERDTVPRGAWGRKRALAECHARREVLREYDDATAALKTFGDSDTRRARLETLEDVIRLLVNPYQNHADFDMEWWT